MFIFGGGAAAAVTNPVTKSLRLRASAEAMMERTFGAPTSDQKMTFSFWVKRGVLGSTIGTQTIFANSIASGGQLSFSGRNELRFDSASNANVLVTTQIFCDPTAMYHVVFAIDTTQATAANRMIFYVNGVRVTLFSTATYPTQNANIGINQATLHSIGCWAYYSVNYFDGVLADFYFIDGAALTPSAFSAAASDSGVLAPIAYSGTYGATGFHLKFDNVGSVEALGTDSSSNGNAWTPNNVSLTAGATYDSFKDVPLLVSATVANYATLNPLNPAASTLTNGNLKASGTTDLPTIIPTSGTYYFEISGVSKTWTPPAAFPSAAGNYNFGQQPFTNTPSATLLNAFSLASATIIKGNVQADATIYVANAGTLNVVNAGAFKPDFVWAESRTYARGGAFYNSTAGVTKLTYPYSTAAEATLANSLTAFNANGFTLGSAEPSNLTNGGLAVAWQWKLNNGSVGANTDGSITSSVQLNATAGFSLVTWTGTGANGTVGHGLGVAPAMIIVKDRTHTYSPYVYHAAIGNTNHFWLDYNDGATALATAWNNTSPTSAVFSVGSSVNTNASAGAMIAYCWTPIAGFSVFGTYVGNGADRGPMINLGFKPAILIIKRMDSTSTNEWYMVDSARNQFNPVDSVLFPNATYAESGGYNINFLSVGFQINNTNAGLNASSGNYCYAAFAANPFKNSIAF